MRAASQVSKRRSSKELSLKELSLDEKRFAPTIPGEFVFDALEAYRFYGNDTDILLRELGFDPDVLVLAGNRVSVIDYATLIERIISELKHGCVGFTDEQIPVKAFSVFACQLAGCENIAQIIQQINRFYALFTKQFHLEVVQEPSARYKEPSAWHKEPSARYNGPSAQYKELLVEHKESSTEPQKSIARIVLHYEETQNFDYRFIYQSIMIMLVRLISWFIGVDIRCRQVQFTFERSHLDKHLRYLFDCPLEYGRSHNEIHIDAELLYQPSSTTLEQVDAMLKDSRWMMLVSHKSAPFTREVRKMLILNHETGGLSVEEVAERMSVSKNLLWRRLKKENTNFLDIRDEVKRDIALSSLNDHELSISDIAYKTGFSDLSSFNKAFTKWTGQSPSAYRKSFNRNLT